MEDDAFLPNTGEPGNQRAAGSQANSSVSVRPYKNAFLWLLLYRLRFHAHRVAAEPDLCFMLGVDELPSVSSRQDWIVRNRIPRAAVAVESR
jgi:hypothetical protein